ncbi:HD domain-containing protein [Maribacter sp. 4G9]|uniref:HD domain-containing protein n=1 Tax=Maribacter sp. 4G9 TaxID=1889777 RepID=UPI000C15C819|nr:HD domain-containing protein [Maribacter sp. 4G9]PIB27565.1 metal-dependent phosphohydrolase [Maribacter sp. 4G9]
MIEHGTILKSAEKYMRTRKNDVHIPISYSYAMKLADNYPEADRDVVGAAIILHDIGWYSIDEEDIFKKGFQSKNFMKSDVRYLHESEGVKLGTEVLKKLGYADEFIEKVCYIIDGHDTRDEARSLEDKIVRDADKLWRFTLTGVSVASDWFKQTPSQYCARLETDIIPLLDLPESKEMAMADLEETKTALCADIL